MLSHSSSSSAMPVAAEQTAVVSTNYFTVQRVETGNLLNETYRLRFQVYCLERGFLCARDYPDHRETDMFDPAAIHILARHKRGQAAGTARLVLYSPEGFPVQRHCVFDEAFAFLRDPACAALATYGEISRLSIAKHFRRRAGDNFYGGEPRGAEHSLSDEAVVNATLGPEILTGILKFVYQESKRRGITHWVVAMERGLEIMLRRMGFPFTPAGPEVDFGGSVRPYVAEIAGFDRTVPKQRPKMAEYMLDGLPQHLRPGASLNDGPV